MPSRIRVITEFNLATQLLMVILGIRHYRIHALLVYDIMLYNRMQQLVSLYCVTDLLLHYVIGQ